MKTRVLFLSIISFIFSFISTPSLSHALERDFVYIAKGAKGEILYSNELCLNFLQQYIPLPQHLELKTIPLLKKHQRYSETCPGCEMARQVYAGYFIFKYKRGYPFLGNQINYAKKYPNFEAYWPETSEKAENINNTAVRLFKDLFSTTALRTVLQSPQIRKHFITKSSSVDDLSDVLYISLASQCFRFSDYYIVCSDLRDFSENFFTREDFWVIDDKLGDILFALRPLFLDMYHDSMTQHPTDEIRMEMQFIQMLSHREDPELLDKALEFDLDVPKGEIPEVHSKNPPNQKSNQYEFLVELGTIHNEYYLHTDAITMLSQAIALNKNKVDAYIERAHAFFELDRIDLAIKDYEKIRHLQKKELSFFHPEWSSDFLYDSSLEFDEIVDDLHFFLDLLDEEILYPKGWLNHYVGGFCSGLTIGATQSLVDFVPNTFSCCRGILHGIWSFAKDPKKGGVRLIETSYNLIEILRQNTLKEDLELVVPELKELFLKWDTLDSYDKGKKVGFIVGKYGIDIFAPFVTMKTIKKYQAFRRANTLTTLRSCAKSKKECAIILERSASHATTRQVTTNAAKAGKIVPLDGNKISHIMQKKHAWDKVIPITGNKTEDFKKAAALLEEQQILSKISGVKELKYGRKQIICETNVSGYTIEAHFIQHPTGETLLNNAWVITK